MKTLPRATYKAFGFLALLLGAALIAFVTVVLAAGGRELLTAPGSLALVFLFSLALLLACSGFTLAFRGWDQAQRSLVPRWALAASGSTMLF